MSLSSCPTSNSSYFDTPDFLITSLHIVSIISTPFYFLGMYCILFKTPTQMKSVKPYLLNLHFWIILFDNSITILTIPFLLLPEMAMIPYGLLRRLGVPTPIQTFTSMVVMANEVIAIIAIYEIFFFFFILCTFPHKQFWAHGRRIWLILNYLIIPIILAPMLLLGPSQEAAKRELFQNLPCLPEYLHQEPIYVIAHLYTMRVGLFIIIFDWLQGGFFITQLVYNGKKQLKSKTMSEKTYQMHKQFFKGLVIQIMILFFLLTVPFLYALETHHIGSYNQSANNLALISVTTHGFVSTVVMILVHRPYRLAVKEMIRNVVEKEQRKTTVVSIR